jgi:hypothetical protein
MGMQMLYGAWTGTENASEPCIHVSESPRAPEHGNARQPRKSFQRTEYKCAARCAHDGRPPTEWAREDSAGGA